MSRLEVLEYERVVRDVEVRAENFMVIEEGEEPLEINDGVESLVHGSLCGRTVRITIHVQPALDSDYWRTHASRARPALYKSTVVLGPVAHSVLGFVLGVDS